MRPRGKYLKHEESAKKTGADDRPSAPFMFSGIRRIDPRALETARPDVRRRADDSGFTTVQAPKRALAKKK